MTASSSGAHRHRRRAHQSGGTATATPLRRAIAVLFGVAVLLVGGFTGVRPAGAVALPDLSPLADTVHRDDIALTDSSSPYLTGALGDAAAVPAPAAFTFDDSLRFLLDDMLGVGQKTLPQLIAPDPSLTVGQLLGMSSNGVYTVNTSMNIDSLLYLLGLNNINVSDVMAALSLPVLKPGTSTPTTFNDILDQMQLSNVKLDQILTPLGIPSTQTLYGLVDRFSSVNETLAVLMARIGPIGNPMTQTVQQGLQSIGMGGFYNGWFTGCSIFSMGLCMLCSGVTGTVEQALNCIKTEYANADSQHPNITLSSSQTAKYLLTHLYQLVPGTNNADFSKPIGNYTIGQALGFDGNTTVKQLVNGPTGYEADPNHTGIWINTQVTIGQWQNGIVNGSPSGPAVVTTLSGNPWRGYTDHIGNNYGGGPSNGQTGHNSTGVLPWNYHTTNGANGPTSPCGGGVFAGCSPVWVNTAPADGHLSSHHPPENNIPNNGGIPSTRDPVIPMTTQPLGTTAWGDILSWFNLPPNKSIADVIGDFWVGDTQLGYYKIYDALMGLVVNPGALGAGLTDNTLVTDFMTAIGFNSMTLDQFIGLDPWP